MQVCPSLDQLRQLLDDRQLGAPPAEIVDHVQECVDCRKQLEDLTRNDERRIMNLNGDFDETVTRHHDDPGRTPTPLPVETDPTAEVVDVARSEATTDVGVADSTIDAIEERTSEFKNNSSADTSSLTESPDRSSTVESASRSTDCAIVPGYEVMERLGEGGMGVVFKARQVGLDRLVALKMIRGGTTAQTDHFARFSIEAEAVARLHHPNILTIYDFGVVGNLPYVSLELLAGGSLADRLDGVPQPGADSAKLLILLARAIHAAHQGGIIHRDLKPSNILYTSDGVPKIADFGLAKRVDSGDDYTESGQIMGSPSYMSPEQASGNTKNVGPSADVYALGAILYEMLTGRPPFRGESPMDTVLQVISSDPVAPSRLVPRLARDLETICLKCLNKEPHKRYESAHALADDLERYQNGEPIRARPTSLAELAVKWARRHPLKAVASFAGIMLTSGLIVGGFAYERQLRLDEQAVNKVVEERQADGWRLVEKADAARPRGDLDQIQEELAAFLPTIIDKPRLATLAERIKEKQKQLQDDRAARQSEQARREKMRQNRERFTEFRTLSDQSQLYAAQLMVLDPDEHRKALRSTTLAALALYGRHTKSPPVEWSLIEPLPEGLDPAEINQVKTGCHDLLLNLAEALDPADGLKVIDRAARLVPEPTVGELLLRAALLGQTKDLTGQARELELAAKLKPRTAHDHLLIARDQLARGLNREAIRSSENALQLDPHQLGAQLLLARLYFNTERYYKAKNSLNTCIRTFPKLLGLYLFRALISGEQGNLALLTASETPENRLEAADEFQSAELDYERALDLGPDPNYRYVLYVNRGGMYLHAGQLDRALADFDAAVQLNDRPFHAYALQAQVAQKRGQFDQAAMALNRAIERQPDRPELFRARALLATRRGPNDGRTAPGPTPVERAQAIDDLGHAIRLETADSAQKADDFAERGRLFFASGETKRALEDYDSALRIVPTSMKALRLRTLALLELGRFDDVLASCDRFLAQGKPSADLLEIRGQARLARKNFAGAIDDYTVAMTLTPDSSALVNRRGWAYLFSDAFQLALADFNSAIRLDQGHGHAYSGRGLALVSLGRWREALSDVENAIRHSTANLEQQAYYNAARVYALALKYAADDVTRRGEAALARYRQLRERASVLLLESVRLLPAEKRASFVRDVVATDPVLKPFSPK